MQRTIDDALGRRWDGRSRHDGVAVQQREPVADAFAADPVLGACLDACLDAEAEDDLIQLRAYYGSAEAEELARIANAHRPTLRLFDHDGLRIDQLELHPAYHALMNRSVAAGLVSSAWEDGGEHREHRLRAATMILTAECERGHLVPISSTHAAIASLAHAPELEAELFPLIASRRYDRRALSWQDKSGALVALALSEAHGGDQGDPLATEAEATADDTLRVTGSKAFVAAPASDHYLTLVRTREGPTAAMVPRVVDGAPNAVLLEGLCDAMGLAAQAFAAVRFEGALAHPVGEPGRGREVLRDVRTLTEFDAALVATGAIRASIHRAAQAMRRGQGLAAGTAYDALGAEVLADLALECAAQTALSLRLATAFDQAYERDGDHALARLVTPAARLYAIRAALGVAQEARESVGVAALATSHPATRILSDVAAYASWEGSAQQAAARLAAMVRRDPVVLGEALDEIGAELGSPNADLCEETERLGERAAADPSLAAAFAERLAMLTAASAMRRNLPRVVSDAYIATRLRDRHRVGYGAIDTRFDAHALIDFIVPES